MSETLLQIENISVNYGHVTALIEASLEAKKGQIVSIIGSNGVGKRRCCVPFRDLLNRKRQY